MEYWERRIAESGVFDRIDELRGELTADEWGEDVSASVERTLRALAYMRKRFDGAEPELIGTHIASQVRDQLVNALAQVRAYRNNPDPAYFNNVDAQIDAALATTALTLPPRDAARDASSAEVSAFKEFVRSADAEVRSQVGELRAQIESTHARLAQSATELESRVDSVEGEVANLRTAAGALLEEQKEAHAQTLQEFGRGAEELRSQFDADAEDVLARLRELQKQAEDLVGTIARTGMTGGYQEYEQQERTVADAWRRYAVWFGLASVVVLAAGFAASFVDPSRDQGDDLASVALTATLLGLATYAARQSARHRGNATSARTTALELASLGPYLETIDEARRQEVIEAFAFVFFGQRPSGDEPNDAVAPANLQAAIDLLRRRKGAPQ